jgi:hypothetical protein
MANQELTIKDILIWIFEHKDDQDSMDSINKMTYPFTTRYERFSKKGNK